MDSMKNIEAIDNAGSGSPSAINGSGAGSRGWFSRLTDKLYGDRQYLYLLEIYQDKDGHVQVGISEAPTTGR